MVDLFADAPKKMPRMAGQGRKGLEFENKVKETLDDQGALQYQVARAKKEAWAAKTVELDYRIKLNEYVSRDEVRQTCATAFASIVQALRSLPDALERREGIDPALAERIGVAIDDALAELSADFERLAGDAREIEDAEAAELPQEDAND